MKFLKLALRALSFSPYLYLAFFYSYVVRAIWHLRKIPYYNNPDPSYLFEEHRTMVDKSFEIGLIGIVGYILLTLLSFLFKSGIEKKYLKIFLGGILFTLLHFFFDPFFGWYVD